MKVVIAVLALAAVATALPMAVQENDDSYYYYEFGQWTQKYSRQYAGVEDFHGAFNTFKANLKMINEHNAAGKTFTLAMNEFGDMSFEEFSRKMLGYTPANVSAPETHVMSGVAAPSEVDWRKKGIVNSVKNQGQCGSCWAFSAVASLESANAQATGKLPNLSEQQLVDCSGSYGNMGCNGGLMDNAFNYWIKESKGDDSESSYPYKAVDGSCKFNKADISGTISSYKDIPRGNEDALKDALSQHVVSIAVAVQTDFQFYSHGVYKSDSCQGKQLNHGVALVGYSGSDYYILRNSWGTSWGMSGYMNIAQGRDECGLADSASYPVV